MWWLLMSMRLWLKAVFNPARADFEAVQKQWQDYGRSIEERMEASQKSAERRIANAERREERLFARVLKIERMYDKCEKDRLENDRRINALEIQNANQQEKIERQEEKIEKQEAEIAMLHDKLSRVEGLLPQNGA